MAPVLTPTATRPNSPGLLLVRKFIGNTTRDRRAGGLWRTRSRHMVGDMAPIGTVRPAPVDLQPVGRVK